LKVSANQAEPTFAAFSSMNRVQIAVVVATPLAISLVTGNPSCAVALPRL